MKNFKTIWAQRANAKSLTSADMLARAVCKAMNAKHEDKDFLIDHFVMKAFSPRKQAPHYHAVKNAARVLHWYVSNRKEIFGVPVTEVFESDEEYIIFLDFVKELRDTKNYG